MELQAEALAAARGRLFSVDTIARARAALGTVAGLAYIRGLFLPPDEEEWPRPSDELKASVDRWVNGAWAPWEDAREWMRLHGSVCHSFVPDPRA